MRGGFSPTSRRTSVLLAESGGCRMPPVRQQIPMELERGVTVTLLTMLWLPILVSAVFVFIASSIIHMTPLWHRNEYPALPDEDAARAAIGGLNVPPGDYMLPRCDSMKEMNTPEFKKKLQEGPRWVITALPAGDIAMGASLVQWFLFTVVVAVFAAYVSGHALAPGANYHEVFRFIGATTFMAFAFGQLPQSIWFKRRWSTTLKHVLDGLIYALITAGTFGWLWP